MVDLPATSLLLSVHLEESKHPELDNIAKDA